MDSIVVRTWYLEMTAPPIHCGVSLPPGVIIMRAKSPTISFYKYLYTQVGKGFSWYNRLLMFDDELVKIITHPLVEIHVIYKTGTPAGFCELDRRVEGETEISYFGIIPEYRRMGFGKIFLDWMLDYAWSKQPKRVWLHTCELDHKNALRLYLNAGFRKYNERLENQLVLKSDTDESAIDSGH